MANALLKTENLGKDYRLGSETVHALRGVSVEIRRGDFVAVTGPSGSGKSTFMNLPGCLDSPTFGRYLLDGRDVSHLAPDDLARPVRLLASGRQVRRTNASCLRT